MIEYKKIYDALDKLDVKEAFSDEFYNYHRMTAEHFYQWHYNELTLATFIKWFNKNDISFAWGGSKYGFMFWYCTHLALVSLMTNDVNLVKRIMLIMKKEHLYQRLIDAVIYTVGSYVSHRIQINDETITLLILREYYISSRPFDKESLFNFIVDMMKGLYSQTTTYYAYDFSKIEKKYIKNLCEA